MERADVVCGDAKSGWWIESAIVGFTRPELVVNCYRISGARPARGNMGPAPVLAPGLVVRYVRDSAYPNADAKGGRTCRWSAYKDGAYLEVEADVEAFKQDVRPVPAPKVRAGIELRWNGSRGHWEKLLKSKGWVPA